jgi:2-polyprenyl-3-methyl-5-hydroxy-6-metoxy-1,4-benzoquinol methylase
LEGRVECVAELDDSGARYDLITALEVLEHLPLPERLKFYGFLTRRLAEGGRVLIELPIEYGPMLLLKEWGRRFLKNRVSEYSARELLDAALLAKIHDAHLRYMTNDERTFISLHRGFDLAKLIAELSSFGAIKEIVRSPFQFLPRMFNQVVLFSYEIHERDISRIEEAVIRVSMSNR